MGVGLQPLEFTECLTDSPTFREKLHTHEKELERTSQQIKGLIKEVKDLLNAAKNLSKAQRTLSYSLINFNFECIGTSQTDDEVSIAKSLSEFGRLISNIEDQRDMMLDRAYEQIILPLEKFRKEEIGAVKDGKKKFEKETAKFYLSQERYLNLSTRKQENVLQEADANLMLEKRAFSEASLEYVFLLQEVQEKKKFEFVETLLGFMYSWLTFYHHGHEVASDFKPYMNDLQLKIQKTRNNFDATRDHTEKLKKKMQEITALSGAPIKPNRHEGYLYLMEKKAFGTTWTKQYCTYQKDTKEFTMVPYNHLTGKQAPGETIKLASCVRRMSESIEKRFCFDITPEDRPGVVYTLQALSDEDRRLWMDVMDGKEPVSPQSLVPTYSVPGKSSKSEETSLDETGFRFVSKCIEVLEKRGLEETGLYRMVGLNSKVTKLLQMCLDKRKPERLQALDDESEWESKTITSALKTYLRNLPEPLMTFRHHNAFVAAAKQETKSQRVNDVHTLVHRLPQMNFDMLNMLVRHLKKVAEKSEKNRMTVSNLSTCFGPTLLRPEEETVAAIMETKFFNVVIEILIENYDKIFRTSPEPSEIPNLPATTQIQPHLGMATNIAAATNGGIPLHHNHNHNHVIPPPRAKYAHQQSSHAVAHLVRTYDTPTPVSLGGGMNHVGITGPGYGISPTPSAHATGLPTAAHHKLQPSIVSSRVSPSGVSAFSESNLLSLGHPSYHSYHSKPHYFYSTRGSPERLDVSMSSSTETLPVSVRDGSGSLVHVQDSPQKNKRGGTMHGNYTAVYRPPQDMRVRTLYACQGENDGELSFEPNQIITNVRGSQEPGWLEGTLNGKTGLIPENYVEKLP